MQKKRLAKATEYLQIIDGCVDDLTGTINVPSGTVIVEERDYCPNPFARDKQWFRLCRFILNNKLTNWLTKKENQYFLERRYNLPN